MQHTWKHRLSVPATRRKVLQAGGIASLGLTLPGLLQPAQPRRIEACRVSAVDDPREINIAFGFGSASCWLVRSPDPNVLVFPISLVAVWGTIIVPPSFFHYVPKGRFQ